MWSHPAQAPAALGDCGQPVTNGSVPVASDCLFILKTAVEIHGCDPACICDTNDGGGITASDALVCLRKAVGHDVDLACDCPSTSTSTTPTTTTATSSTTLPGACVLLVNGDLDDPVTTSPENGWEFANVEAGEGWKSEGGNPGGFFRLNQTGQVGSDPTLSQEVSGLVIGSVYRVRGQYRSYAPAFGDPAKLDAFAVKVGTAGGGGAALVFGFPRPSPDDAAWTDFHADFSATAGTVTVSFVAERDGDDSSFDVDNLCLAPR